MSVYQKLLNVQAKLKVPKARDNDYGGYKYRSAEDICETAKPILAEEKLLLKLEDYPEFIEGRHYIRAVATVIDTETGEYTTAQALAREPENHKKMDPSQVTGATSSYARKYAMGGIFALDDERDADALNDHDKAETPKATAKPKKKQKNKADDAERLELMNDAIHLASEKGIDPDKLDKGVHKYFGKKNIGELTIPELHKLMERISEKGVNGNAESDNTEPRAS